MNEQPKPVKGSRIPDLRPTCRMLWVAVCIVVMAFLFFSGWINYETNDDLFISALPGGLWGDYSPYTTYSNIALGALAALLSKLVPLTNWTIFLYLIGMLLSWIMMGRCLIRQNGWLSGGLLSATVLLGTFFTSLHKLNYSKAGALIVMLSALCFAVELEEMSKDTAHPGFGGHGKYLLLPGALLVFGSLFRFKTTLAVLPFLVLIATHNLESADKVRKFKQVLIAWMVVGLASLLFWGVDFCLYQSNPAWKEYRTFNSLREDLLDYELPSYEEHTQEYQALGWSKNDYEMFSEWSFADSSVYNVTTLQAVKNMQTTKPYDLGRIKSLIVPLTNMVKSNFLLQVLLGFALILILLNPGKFWYLLLSLCFTAGELALLADQNRYPERAVFISVIASFAVLLFLSTTWHRQTRLIEVTLYLALFLLCGYVSECRYYGSTLPYDDHNRFDSTEFFAACTADENSLYIWEINSLAARLSTSLTPVDAFPVGALSNTVALGGWTVPSPTMNAVAENAIGSDNLLQALATNPATYYVSTTEDVPIKVLAYLREHYNPTARCTLVGQSNGCYLYQFTATE